MIRRASQRVYADLLASGREKAYACLLRNIAESGYSVCPLASFWKQVNQETWQPEAPLLLLRHDVDSDPAAAKAMWALEQQHGFQSTYYFRLSTLDIPLMKAISWAGGEVGYHYEEAATVAKRHRLKTKDQVYAEMNTMKELFSRNLADLRARTGLPLTTAASHGDFANRRTGVFNRELLVDEKMRKENNIELEAYDRAFLSHVSSRHSDTRLPPYWTTEHPLKAMERRERVVLILIHPDNWYSNRRRNLVAVANRIWEGIRFSR